MATLPQLIEEDIRRMEEILREFLRQSGAMIALVVDKGGFLLAHQGESADLDLTSIGALASGAFMANQAIAGLINEKSFESLHQHGENFSLFISDVDEHCLLIVLFKSAVGVGLVKYYAPAAVQAIAQQLLLARGRDPLGGLDLSELNSSDPREFFRKKAV